MARVALPAALALFVLISRAAYVSDFVGVNRDGPRYVNALNLDSTYDIPAPGKIGFVVLAVLVRALGTTAPHAYAVVTIGLSIAAAIFIYLFAGLYLSRPLAAAVSLAIMSGPIVWSYGSVIASYIVWLACFPAIGYFAVRFVRERKPALVIAAAIATGVASILRADMLVFAGPLLAGTLALGRAPFRSWLVSGAICFACTCIWFFATAEVSGGVGTYLEMIRSQREYHLEAGIGTHTLGEALARNGSKYALFLVWDALLLVLLAAYVVMTRLGPARRCWKELTLFALWMAPTLGFSLLMTTVTGGLIFPLLPLLGVAAAEGLLALTAGREGLASAGMIAVAALSAAQFVFAPLLPCRTERDVIINVMFTKQAGPAIRAGFSYNLSDFQIDSSLSHVIQELRAADPVPVYPPDFRGPR